MTQYRIVKSYRHQDLLIKAKDLVPGYVIQYRVETKEYTDLSGEPSSHYFRWEDLWPVNYKDLNKALEALEDYVLRKKIQKLEEKVVYTLEVP